MQISRLTGAFLFTAILVLFSGVAHGQYTTSSLDGLVTQ